MRAAQRNFAVPRWGGALADTFCLSQGNNGSGANKCLVCISFEAGREAVSVGLTPTFFLRQSYTQAEGTGGTVTIRSPPSLSSLPDSYLAFLACTLQLSQVYVVSQWRSTLRQGTITLEPPKPGQSAAHVIMSVYCYGKTSQDRQCVDVSYDILYKLGKYSSNLAWRRKGGCWPPAGYTGFHLAAKPCHLRPCPPTLIDVVIAIALYHGFYYCGK